MPAFASPPALRHLPANAEGRDFVVGDLHGMIRPLETALAQAHFHPQVDRLFSVGDLVDRGPDSMACLRLLREPWFVAVRGNHERMLLAHLGYPESWVSRFHAYRYSRHWVDALSVTDRRELIEDLAPRVAQLPLVVRVGTPDAAFYVLHAERRWQGRVLTDVDLEAALAGSVVEVPRGLREALTWSRQGIVRALAARSESRVTLPGVSPTYVGHTISTPLSWEGHTYLDRGAYRHRADRSMELLQIG